MVLSTFGSSSGGSSPATALYSGYASIAEANTAVQLGDKALTQGVWVNARLTNEGAFLLVGGVGLIEKQLYPGSSPIFLAVDNVNLIWINGATVGDTLEWTGS